MRPRLAAALRRVRASGERGFSLVESMVAVALFGCIVVVMGPVMTSGLAAGRQVDHESRALDEARTAIARIDRELRSACEVSAPAVGNSGSVLTFKTQAGANGATYEVTYSIVGGVLTRVEGGASQAVADGLVVTSQEFTHTENANATRAQIGVDLDVTFEAGGSPRRLSTVISGRNTWTACT